MMDPKPKKKPKKPYAGLRRTAMKRGGSIKPKPKPAPPPEVASYKSDIHKVDCVICKAFGLRQESPTTMHHWIMGRYSQRKTPDLEAIALCDGHHQANFDDSKIAIHSEPKKWKAAYGKDNAWIEATQKAVEDYRMLR